MRQSARLAGYGDRETTEGRAGLIGRDGHDGSRAVYAGHRALWRKAARGIARQAGTGESYEATEGAARWSEGNRIVDGASARNRSGTRRGGNREVHASSAQRRRVRPGIAVRHCERAIGGTYSSGVEGYGNRAVGAARHCRAAIVGL